MTRNIVIVKADGDFRSFNDAAEDEHLLSLGARESVLAAITAAFPGIVFDESGAGTVDGILIEVGIDDPVEDVAAVLPQDADVEPLLAFVRSQGWHATESGGGDFIDL